MSFFETIKGLFPSTAWMYITVGLAVVLVILVITYLMKKSIWTAAKNRLARALEKKGVIVESKEETEKISPKLLKEGIPSEKELKRIGDKLRVILDKEKLLKQKERIFTQEIGRLYKQAKALEEKDKQATKKETTEQKREGIVTDDVKKVLKVTDDLLGNLPDDVIEKFSKSKDFQLYKKVIKKAR